MTCGIYKIENQINHKVYIGQSIEIERRFEKHKNAYLHNQKWLIYKAFAKYGLQNFSFDIIEECDRDKLDEREIYWIAFYDSYNNGYNMTIGGADRVIGANDKEVKQYNTQGEYITSFISAHEAERQTGISFTNICKCCRGERKHAGGYIWRYNNSEIPVNPITINTVRFTKVLQIDKNTNEIIAEFNSMSEAARQVLSANKTGIGKCCKGLQGTCGGYKWRFKDENMD